MNDPPAALEYQDTQPALVAAERQGGSRQVFMCSKSAAFPKQEKPMPPASVAVSFRSWMLQDIPPSLHTQPPSARHALAPADPGRRGQNSTMKWTLASLLALAGPSQAALRFGCSTVSIQRLDPLVEPGRIPSAHLHQIVGGNAFNATMDPADGDVAAKATCTTCTFSEDFSNYWTAVMFFKHPNGTYKRVPIMQNTALPAGINGGMTVYYTQQDFFSNGNQKITAFPKVRTR